MSCNGYQSLQYGQWGFFILQIGHILFIQEYFLFPSGILLFFFKHLVFAYVLALFIPLNPLVILSENNKQIGFASLQYSQKNPRCHST